MRTVATVVVLGLLAAGPALSGSESVPLAPSITPAELQSRLESSAAPVVIDVRTPEEYAAGHVPGALNIPFDRVAERISDVEAPHGVALYCMVGPRARKGEAALLASGYTDVLHLEGGLNAWQEGGLPVAREP
jgi:phage shock protein E